MLKKVLVAINVAFSLLLIFSVCIVFLGFSRSLDYNLYIIGGTLLIVGLLFNWYFFYKLTKKGEKK
ncbi:hypothetical protein [Bavariicoccus seileri]|uniref:hypothetical protein n=1 Tax=Bavariicoccus seileri TaxID=549685 RepID=UPI003F97711B